MNWWQTLIVGNLAFLAAVVVIAWLLSLLLCGSPWQRVVGIIGLLVVINLCAFLSVDAKRSRRAELPASRALASGASPVNGEATPASSEPDEKTSSGESR